VFIEFTLSAILEAGTGGGVDFVFKYVESGGSTWSFPACAIASVSNTFEPARFRLHDLLSRMPNRDLFRASALSRFDTAEPVEVADWGDRARRLLKRNCSDCGAGAGWGSHLGCCLDSMVSSKLTCKFDSKASNISTAPSRFLRRSQVASQIGHSFHRTKYSVRAPLPRLARMLSTSYSSPSDEAVAGGGRVSARVRKGNATLPSW
jgi:hypothetical protein